MIASPCLHPLYITDCYGRKRSVPCGRCAACLVNKGLHRTQRLQQYTADYPFQWFLTLTFNDEHLPLAYYSSEDNRLYSGEDCDYNGEVYSLDLSDIDDISKDYIERSINKYGGVPVLSHRRIILFKKRLRDYLSRKFDNYATSELFIYNVGEYGPTNYRPHYHLILCSKQNIPTSLLKSCCSSAWSVCDFSKERPVRENFGFIYLERVGRKGCESYIEKYINCTSDLPSLYSNGVFRQFSSGSTRVDKVLHRLQCSEIREVYYRPVHALFVNKRNRQALVPVPDSYRCRFFPLIPRFGLFSDGERYILYRMFQSQRFPIDWSAERCYQAYLEFSNCNLDWTYSLEYKNAFVGRDFSFRPDTLLEMLVDSCCFRELDGSIINDEYKRKRNWCKLFYVSKRVCLNAQEVGVSVRDYVDKIISYYQRVELDKLARFYELQEKLLNDPVAPLPLNKLFPLYYNTDAYEVNIDYYLKQFGWSGQKIQDIPDFQRYSFLMHGILKDTTKTKKRNDLNYSRGLRKKPFIPFIHSNINRFIQI